MVLFTPELLFAVQNNSISPIDFSLGHCFSSLDVVRNILLVSKIVLPFIFAFL